VIPANRIFSPLESLPHLLETRQPRWFLEAESESFFALWGIRDLLYEKQSEYQLIQLADFADLGRTLILDGRIQVAESDEYIYHDMLVHPAMVMAQNIGRVLILGGGDGCALREVLKWPDVKEVCLVEIDEDMIETFKVLFPEWTHGAFEDERVTVRISDASTVLNENQTWNVIISDLTEPYDDTGDSNNLSERLFTKDFFSAIGGKLRDRGIFAAQTGGIRLSGPLDAHHVEIIKTIRSAFRVTRTAYEYIPSFNATWTTTFACQQNTTRISDPPVHHALARNGLQLRYYTPGTHCRLFTAAPEIRNLY